MNIAQINFQGHNVIFCKYISASFGTTIVFRLYARIIHWTQTLLWRARERVIQD